MFNYNEELLDWIDKHADDLDHLDDPNFTLWEWCHKAHYSCLATEEDVISIHAQALYFLIDPEALNLGWERVLDLYYATSGGVQLPQFHYSHIGPSVVIPQSNEDMIYCQTFYHCPDIESFTINKDDFRVLDVQAFEDCTSLKNVDLKSCKEIGAQAFKNCVNLENIYLPDGLEKIADQAFINCPKLKVLEIPQSVNMIGEHIIGSLSPKTSRIGSGKTRIRIRGLNKEQAAVFTLHHIFCQHPATQALFIERLID